MDNSDKSMRKYPRISWGFVIRFRLRGGDVWEVGTIKNISEGGCYFGTGKEMKVGLPLEIQVQFPAIKEPMRFVGEVTRCESGDAQNLFFVGIKFLEMDQQKKDEFLHVITFFLKKQKKADA